MGRGEYGECACSCSVESLVLSCMRERTVGNVPVRSMLSCFQDELYEVEVLVFFVAFGSAIGLVVG